MTCRTCGSIVAEGASCPKCATATVAVSAAASSSRSSSSRPHTTSVPEEGRFVPGTLIAGRYRIVGLLGAGGMGEVYRATDLTLAQPVALKFLAEHSDISDRLLERFHSEVRIARQVSHPNVCRVYDIGEAEGMPFISMEYVDGEDLGSLLQRIGRLPSDKALQIARKLCAGVAAAHDRGIIHRDLKPQNIMLNRRGEVVIMDFGLAAIAEELRGPEARSGTPAYMAPEQLRGEAVTPKSDIYALGLIIYELFTGRRAFDGQSLPEIMRAQDFESPVSLTSLAADADPQVEKAILRCLHRDPAERPASALSLAAALPGGDPLAAALAAGETPSPELVAASGKTQGIATKYAAVCSILCMVALLPLPLAVQRTGLLSMVPMELSPAVLEQKAREIAALLGHKPPRTDEISALYSEPDLVLGVSERDKGRAKDWGKLLKGESPYRVVYRQSPKYLVSLPDGAIDADRPSNTVPGMILMELSGSGLLRRFEAVVGANEKMPQTPVDEAFLFKSAGLDVSQFHETPNVTLPKVPFDSTKAWKGPHPGLPGIEMTVQTAMWKGTPVEFSIVWPWTELPDTTEKPSTARDLAFQAFRFVLLGSALFSAIYFARRNLLNGRGDRQGATRLAVFVALLKLADVLLKMHYVPSLAMTGILFNRIALVLADCSLLWMLYIAIEPAVRRNWPHTLITWNRLLAGNWLDPRVAWHILVGVMFGLVARYGFLLRQYVNLDSSPPAFPNTDFLSGPSWFVGSWAMQVENAIAVSFVIFLLMCGLKFIVRRDWIAAAAAAIFMSLQEGAVRTSTNLPVDLSVYVLIIFALALVLLRLGVIPSIMAIVVINATAVDIGPTYLAWYNSVAVAQIVIVATIIGLSGWASQRQPARPAFARA